MEPLAELAAAACALLFLGAVAGKLDSWSQWARLSEEMPGPAGFGLAVRVAVPAIESAIVVLSLTRPAAGLAAAAVVLGCFAVAVWLLARRLAGRECNCFGAIAPATISGRLAARNAGLAVLAAAGAYLAAHEQLRALSLSDAMATVLVGAILLLVVQYRRLRRVALVDEGSRG